MKTIQRAGAAGLLALLAAFAAHADQPATQSRQALIDAMRHGEIASGEAGVPMHDPALDAYRNGSGVTRAQVESELRQAMRSGDVAGSGEAGMTAYEQDPAAYPARPLVAGKTRQQVEAETLQAMHDGEIVTGEVGSTGASDPADSAYARLHTPAVLASGPQQSGPLTASTSR